MPKVIYLGRTDMVHASNPTGTEYMFYSHQPTEVKPEDAKHYAKKEANGAPWKVDFGIIEQAAEAVKEVVQPKSRNKYGGKK